MLIPSVHYALRQLNASLSRGTNANSQRTELTADGVAKSIKRDEC